MVYYMDGVVGEMVAMLKSKNMWENTLWVHQSDNGGPSFTGSSHTANNYPQKGSKMSNWYVRQASSSWLARVHPCC